MPNIQKTNKMTIIEATTKFRFINMYELWDYRELFIYLALRDIKLRYKQTFLGILWVILQPFLSTVAFTLIFSIFTVKMNYSGAYPIFIFSGVIPWMFFFNGINSASTSLIADTNLIKKIYFPRIIIPIASIFSGVLDLFINILLFIGILFWFEYPLTFAFLYLPFPIGNLLITTLGVGVWLSALNALYRDIKHTIPFFIQFFMFLTPIVYPINIIPESYQKFYALNPMVGVVESFHFLFIPEQPMLTNIMLISFSVSCFLFITGILYFNKTEKVLADVI